MLDTGWKFRQTKMEAIKIGTNITTGRRLLRGISHRWTDGQLDRAWTRNVSPLGIDLC